MSGFKYIKYTILYFTIINFKPEKKTVKQKKVNSVNVYSFSIETNM